MKLSQNWHICQKKKYFSELTFTTLQTDTADDKVKIFFLLFFISFIFFIFYFTYIFLFLLLLFFFRKYALTFHIKGLFRGQFV